MCEPQEPEANSRSGMGWPQQMQTRGRIGESCLQIKETSSIYYFTEHLPTPAFRSDTARSWTLFWTRPKWRVGLARRALLVSAL